MKLIIIYDFYIIIDNQYNLQLFYYIDDYFNQPNNPLLLIFFDDKKQHYKNIIYNHPIYINYPNNNISHNNNVILDNSTNTSKKLDFDSEINEISKMIKNFVLKSKSDYYSITKDNNLSINEKKELGYNYPIYPKSLYGKDMYIFIRSYLISRRYKSYKSSYPKYVFKVVNIKNEKKYFHIKASKFELDEPDNLMIKVFKKNKNHKKGERKYNLYYLYYIPLIRDLENWLKKLHKETFHRSEKYLVD